MSKSSKKINIEQQIAKEVYNDLITRCKNMKEFNISCYLEEAWVPNGPMPFDMKIKNGIVTCRVFAESKLEAALMISNELPVIMFIDGLID